MPDGSKLRVEKVSVALTHDMAAMVRDAVDSGEFASTSEVVRDALRDWKAKREDRQVRLEELRRLVAEGHASGTVEWKGATDIISRARKASGL